MKPEVSVVICTYNREAYIGQCIKRLAEQTADSNSFEVVIINNNSTDNTEQICHDAINTYRNIKIKYFIEKKQGHSFSRNRGIKESQGNIITFIDDDSFGFSDFVENTADYFKTHPEVQAIGGKIIPQYETAKPKWMSKYLLPLVSALDMGPVSKPFKGTKFPIGANMSFRKEVFERYGLFNTELGRKGYGLEGGDEKEVFIRLKRAKAQIHYVPAVIVDHIIPEKRVRVPYIKGLAIGVGTSEKKRLKGASSKEIFNKTISELVKIIGTLVLFAYYIIFGFRFEAAWMLIKFRWWVLKGYL